MVKPVRAIVWMLAVLVSVGSIVSCGENGPAAGTSPKNPPTAPIRTVLPSPPLECEGISDLATAQALIDGGEAVAFIAATITAQAGPVENSARLVPVEDFTLLAGQLPSGSVNQVQEGAATEKTNILEPGSYLILVGVTAQESTYFLSAGRRGSFVVVDNDAYQRCPNYADPANPSVVRSGITDTEELTAVFAEALSEAPRG